MSSVTVFMSGRDCRAFVQEAIISVSRQTHPGLHVLFVDDASGDGTGREAARLLEAHLPGRYTLVHNPVRYGKARNAFEHLTKAPPSDFVAVLDADDALLDPTVLARMAASYDTGFDVVWTNYRTDRSTRGVNGPLDPLRPPRDQPWRTSHFFSFRRELFASVPKAHLQDDEGNWLQAACDFAIAFPVLDQTRRYRFLPGDAYLYRMSNPASHHNVHGAPAGTASSELQARNADLVLRKPPMACTRPLLSAPPDVVEEGLGAFASSLRQRLDLIETGMEQLVSRQARLAADVVATQVLRTEESIPLAWLGTSGGWSTEVGLLEHLRSVLDRTPSPRVLAFGSGASTKILARLVANRGGRLTTVEHDPVWHAKTSAALESAGLVDTARVVLSPLVDGEFLGVATRFYDLGWLGPDDRFDVVLVGGPSAETIALARLPALPAMADHLAPGFTLVLDDYERGEEKKIVEIWLKVAPGLRATTLDFGREACELRAG